MDLVLGGVNSLALSVGVPLGNVVFGFLLMFYFLGNEILFSRFKTKPWFTWALVGMTVVFGALAY